MNHIASQLRYEFDTSITSERLSPFLTEILHRQDPLRGSASGPCRDVGRIHNYDSAAKYTGLGRRTLEGLVASGRLRASKVGDRVLITQEAINEMLQKTEMTPASRKE